MAKGVTLDEKMARLRSSWRGVGQGSEIWQGVGQGGGRGPRRTIWQGTGGGKKSWQGDGRDSAEILPARSPNKDLRAVYWLRRNSYVPYRDQVDARNTKGRMPTGQESP